MSYIFNPFTGSFDSSPTVPSVNGVFLPLSGGTMTGKLVAAADAAVSKLNIGNALSASSNPVTTINGDMWINSTNRLAFKSNSSVYSVPLINSANAFSSTQSIDLSSNLLPALRITQRGAGEAFRVEDQTSPDNSAFIVGSNGHVGIGLSALNDFSIELTVVGNISATGTIYASSGNSADWDSVYSTVRANSATQVQTVATTTPGISAVTNIVAVSALPASPNPNTLYIIIG